MAQWNLNPSWTPMEQINGGKSFSRMDDVSASDFNKIVENMQYLYVNGGNFEMSNFPVGAIYVSTDNTSPASLFGGTWERITDKFLLSAGHIYEAGATGGSRFHSHGAGDYGAQLAAQDSTSSIQIKSILFPNRGYSPNRRVIGTSISETTTDTNYLVPVSGTSSETSTLPPYEVVHMWKRIA